MKILLFATCSAILAICLVSTAQSKLSCFDDSVKVKSIPDSHLYAKKTKPLVIGHHGNPSKYQENTVDGFKSLVDIKADGLEFDTFLTKDEKLVVIHYDNTWTLTQKSHYIWNTTYEELQKLNLPRVLEYGSDTYKFDKTRKIPLLSDVIDAVKDEGLVMYLNMKPGYVRNRTESELIGKKVAQLITDTGVANNVLLASFDPFKILAAKKENPSLVVGTFYKISMWDENSANEMKNEFGDLPRMKECVSQAPNGTEFMRFLFQSGALLKSTSGSFVVMDYRIFENSKYSNNTFQTFQENYSSDLSFGAFIIDNLAATKEQKEEGEKILDQLIKMKVSCLVTDNVPRLLKKLGKTVTAIADKNLASPLALYALIPFIWFLR